MAAVSALDHLNSLLATKPMVTLAGTRRVIVNRRITTPFGVTIVIPEEINEPFQTQASAKVTNSRVVEVRNLVFDKTKITSLPQSAILTRKTIQNCADATTTSSIGLTLSGTQSWNITKTNGVTTTVGANITGNVGVPGVGGASATLSFSQTFSTSTADSEGGSTQVSRTSNETITIGPKRAVSIELFAYQSSAEIPFSATIIIDGDMETNVEGISQASALLSEAERTLPFGGVLRLADVSEANLRTTDLGGAQGCGAPNEVTTIEEKFPPMPADNLGNYFEKGFLSLREFSTRDKTLFGKRAFGMLPAPGDTGPTIGPADGTFYEILYTTQEYTPTAACGFNDLGVLNLGIFNVEARQYRSYVNGQMVSQWGDSVSTFVGCHNP